MDQALFQTLEHCVLDTVETWDEQTGIVSAPLELIFKLEYKAKIK